jgi:hypothetical protein
LVDAEPIPYEKAIKLAKHGGARSKGDQGGNTTLAQEEKNTVKHILARLDRDGHAEHYQKLDAQTPDLLPVGTNQYSDGRYATKNDVTPNQRGNTDEYAIAKLRKDRPEIHARVLNGELSPNEHQGASLKLEQGKTNDHLLRRLARDHREIVRRYERDESLINIVTAFPTAIRSMCASSASLFAK